MDYEKYLENLENKLISSFDLYRDHKINENRFDLYGRFYMMTERYLLIKKAKIFGMENNEHILVKKIYNLDESKLREFIACIKGSIDHIVDPHPEHMSSIVTGVLVIDDSIKILSDEIVEDVINFRFQKGFSFGLRGWVDIRLLIVSLEDGIVISNKKGREVEKVYKIS